MPMVSALGRTPMKKEGNAIAMTDQSSACLRPNLSPTQPNRAPPKRPHDEAGGERTEGGEERGGGVVGREEVRADLLGEEAEEGEVVPLEHVAGYARDDAPADGARSVELLRDHSGRGDRRGCSHGSSW